MEHVGILEMTLVFCFYMQGEDIIEHTNGNCHVNLHLNMQGEDSKILLSLLMSSVICVDFSQLVGHYVT